MIIKNRDALLRHGNTAAREIVLDVLEAGLAAPDPYENVKKIVRIEDGRLVIGHPDFSEPPGRARWSSISRRWATSTWSAAARSAQRQAEALEEILGDRITGGQINAKKGDSVRLKRIPVTLAGHPIPDEDSVAGARRIVEIERNAKPGDIVFLCHSGGATALTALPAPGISLADLQAVYRLLYFECGAAMPVANAVRNQLVVLHSRHPRYINGATAIQLETLETPPKLRVHAYEAPKYGDGGYRAAIEVLHAYRCWDRVPEVGARLPDRRRSALRPSPPGRDDRQSVLQLPHHGARDDAGCGETPGRGAGSACRHPRLQPQRRGGPNDRRGAGLHRHRGRAVGRSRLRRRACSFSAASWW